MKVLDNQFIAPQKAQLESVSETDVDPTHGGSQYAGQIGHPHQWRLKITTPPLEYRALMALFAFSVSMRGRLNVCQIQNPLPLLGPGLGEAASVREQAEQYSDQIKVQGAPASLFHALLPGDFVLFVGDPKAYMVQNVVNVNSQGLTTISISPPLRQKAPVGRRVWTADKVRFQMALKTDVQKLNLDATNRTGLQTLVLDFEERLL